MKGLNPCPYCKGEVEVVKLNKKKKSDPQFYRIECLHCRRLVARGLGFETETSVEAFERIAQYEKIIKAMYGPHHPERIEQTIEAKRRDRLSGKPRYNEE